MPILTTLLLTAVGYAQDVELVVRLNDQRYDAVDEAWVTVMYPLGTTVTAQALDDGTDAEDYFAGDGIYVARMALSPAREARILVSTAPPGEDVGVVVSRQVVLTESLSRVQIDVPDPEGAAAHEDAALSLSDGTTSREPFPIAAEAEVEVEDPRFDAWSAVRVSTALGLVSTLALLALFTSARIRRVTQRLAAPLAPVPQPEPAEPAPAWARWAVAATASALLAVVWGPAMGSLSTRFLGVEYVDHYGTQWFYWFAQHTLLSGISPSHTDLFFHPWGKDVFGHTGANVLDGYLAMPFRLLLGEVLGYNVFCLVGLAASAAAFYWLALHVVDDRLAAALAAVFYSLQPYTLIELLEGRPTQGITLFAVLFMVFLVRSGQRTGLRAPVAAGVLLALVGYQYWFYGLFGGLVALAHGLWRAWRPPAGAGRGRDVLARHGLAAAVALLIAAPAAIPMIALTAGDGVPGLLDTDQWSIFDTPPITREGLHIGIFSWQPLRRSMGFLVLDNENHDRFLAQTIALPWVVLPLLVAWFKSPARLDRGLFVAVVTALTLVALGPLLMVGDLALPNVFYIYLVKSLGFLRRLWWPSRSIAYIGIFVGMATAAAFAWMLRQRVRWQLAGFSGVAIFWGWELSTINTLPFPSWDAAVPAGYRCLAEGGRGALIELPYSWTQAHLYFQTVHHLPILGGMLEDNPTFTPAEFTEFRTTNGMVSRLLAGDPVSTPYEWSAEDAQEVHDKGYRYVVVQKDAYFNPDEAQGAQGLAILLESLQQAFGSPVYDDGRTAIFAPWGDPAPCDLDGWEVDPAPVGPTEVKQEIRDADRDRQLFSRWPALPK